ncbi:MAG: restriction endonuclease subunit S, partial [Pseudogulbenkiania sp.]|nr:restriction endonuclease subunit S [Pseudogulbenkiania sp.]
IKKPKPLPEIGADEKPFSLPSGWEWVRLDGLSLHSEAGWSPQCLGTPRTDDKWGVLKVSAVTWGKYNPDENKELPANLAPRSEYEVNTGDFLISRANTADLVARAVVVPANIPKRLMLSDKIIRFVFSENINSEYVLLMNNSQQARSYYAAVAGGTSSSMKNVSREQIRALSIPLPPLSEQSRIVAKVDQLMALCDRLEQQQDRQQALHQTLVNTVLDSLTQTTSPDAFRSAWARIAAHFDTLFSTVDSINQLKQTLLQLAVMGKLVPQDPNDEPASVLLQKIAAEKEALVKSGKIKKPKPLPEIGEEEKPFELPVGWEWSQFEQVVSITGGITLGRKLAGRTLALYPYLRVANVQRGYLNLDEIKSIEIPIDEVDKYRLQQGDLLITEGGDWDKVGRTAIWRDEIAICLHQNHVFRARSVCSDWNEIWAQLFLNSTIARDYFAGAAKQTTNLASINMTQLRSCPFPLPPLAEQFRIVAKVDALMALCDRLAARLREAQHTRQSLAEAVVEQALA